MNESYVNQGEQGFQSYLSKAYLIVAVGLIISGICAVMGSILIPMLMYAMPAIATLAMFGLVIGEFVLAVRFSSQLMSMSKSSAWKCYIAYCALTGISFYTLFLYYDLGSLFLAFLATTIMFVCMSIIGKTSNRNLSFVYGLLLPGFIAAAIVSLINALFIHSSSINLFIAYIAIIIFLILTASDVQRLSYFYDQSAYDVSLRDKLLIMGAFQLYLDFINLFIRILRFLGRRNNNNR